MGVGRGGKNIRTSANNSSHAESSCHLKELAEEVVTIGVGNLFLYFTIRIEKDDADWRNKEEAEILI